MTCEFTPENIEKLFGTEAAEQEDTGRLRKYFFKNKTYEDIRANLALRILVAHKGIGKSAMFRVRFSEMKTGTTLVYGYDQMIFLISSSMILLI